MKFLLLLVSMAVWFPWYVYGAQVEVAVPLKTFDGARISVARLVEGECWKEYHGGSLCLKRALTYAHADIEGSKNVGFIGSNLFAIFRSGPFWSRIGAGLGIFHGPKDRIRSKWDFNISIQYGAQISENIGFFFGWEHFSNGRSFAERLGLKRYWPDYNDGGNTLLFGVVVKW